MKKRVIKAVGVVVVDKNKKILIAKRKPDKPMPNKWEFPGGKLEENETLQECGIREIQEELNLDIVIDEYLGYENLEYASKSFCLHIYTAYKIKEEQKLELNEHTDYAWVEFSELVNYDFPAINLACLRNLESLLKKIT